MSNVVTEASSWSPYLKYGERQFYRKKSVIYHENEYGAEGFYYLKRGLIRISTANHIGDERIIDIVSNNNPFGEQTADGDLYFSTASALKDSIVYFFPYKNIKSVMAHDYRLKMLIYTNLTDKLKTLSNTILFHSLPSEKLLARTILVLRDKYVTKNIPFTQQELCRYTSLNRITVYQIFKKWDDNVVTFNNRNILINNVNELRKIAAL